GPRRRCILLCAQDERRVNRERAALRSRKDFRMLLLPLAALLASCGDDNNGGFTPGSNNGGSPTTWQPGVYLPDSTFAGRCARPRPGTSDRAGTVRDENNWLRSWSNHTYLWYSEITDRDPSLYNNPLEYFDLLKTT